ncbi:hypothetical protein, partial [Serratia sp. OLIL2]|uniref:hypothetical protein n=1 Tax=Serratia sp. OLIL2 TaxID=1914913 RepID=UPI001A7E11DB
FIEGQNASKSKNVTGNLLNERKDLSANVNLTFCAVFLISDEEITKNERRVALKTDAENKIGRVRRPIQRMGLLRHRLISGGHFP